MIELKSVSKSYKKGDNLVNALTAVSLHIQEGEMVVLQGRSGSGKSTLLSLIAALSKPTRGEVIVDGVNIAKLSDDFAAQFRLSNIGFIFQKFNLFEEMSVYENLLVSLIPLGLAPDVAKQKIMHTLERVGLQTKHWIRVRSLSGGEQQRVAIARSIINEPKIVLADEPTANLDAKLSGEFIDYLGQLKKQKRTVVVATHDPLFFHLEFVDRVIAIEEGKICC